VTFQAKPPIFNHFGLDALSPDYTRGGVWAFGASRASGFNLSDNPLATLFFLRLDSNSENPLYNCNQLEAFAYDMTTNGNNRMYNFPLMI